MKTFFDWLATMKPTLDKFDALTAPLFGWVESIAGRQLSVTERTLVLMLVTAAVVYVLV